MNIEDRKITLLMHQGAIGEGFNAALSNTDLSLNNQNLPSQRQRRASGTFERPPQTPLYSGSYYPPLSRSSVDLPERMRRLELANQTLTERNEQLSDDNYRLNNQWNIELIATRANNWALREKNQRLSDQVRQKNAEIDNLENVIKAYQENIQNLEQRNNQLEVNNKKLEVKLGKVETKYEEAKRYIKGNSVDVGQLWNDNKVKNKENTRLKRQVNDLRHRN